jgi:hypothetical protein
MIDMVRTIATGAVLALVLGAGAAPARAQSTAVSSVAPPSAILDFAPLGKTPEIKEVQPVVDWLPIWGKEARERGFDLPLPLGVGLTYTYIRQNMVVSDVAIAGRPLGVTLRDADTVTDTGVFRADAWLFPFLNIYALVGYTSGVTRPVLVLPNGQLLASDVKYSRSSWGAGATVAGGWKSFFGTVDANWTTGPIVNNAGQQTIDKPIQSVTITPRFGTLISSGKFGTGAVYVGGMYLLATSEIRAVFDLGGQPLYVDARVKPKDPWNLLIGGSWQPDKRWSITAEIAGVMDRTHFIASAMYRF